MDPEPSTITETDGRVYVDKLIELLGTGAPRWLDNSLAEWRAADLDFQRNGYAATKRAPKHPLIAAIGEYRHWALGTMPSAQIVQLMEAAAAANAFEMNWRGHEPWLAARLRDVNGCRQALFELRTGLCFRALGHCVQYLSPLQQPGPDLRVEHSTANVLIECVQMDASTGHQIPQTAAHEIGRQSHDGGRPGRCSMPEEALHRCAAGGADARDRGRDAAFEQLLRVLGLQA